MRVSDAVDVLWNNILDDDPPAGLTSDALATLDRHEEQKFPTQYVLAGRFYHLARTAYQAVFLGETGGALTEAQHIFSDAATAQLATMIDYIDTIAARSTPLYARESRVQAIYGSANEFTPIAIGKALAGKAVIYLGSRDDDSTGKTDIHMIDLEQGNAVPIQMKTDVGLYTNNAPNNGVVITGRDYDNEFLECTRAVLAESRMADMAISLSANLFLDTVRQRLASKELHEADLARQRAHNRWRRRPLSSTIGEQHPQLQTLHEQLLGEQE